jgi:hypothetical protein
MLTPNATLQLRRAISIQSSKQKDYLRSTLSRRQLQALVRPRGEFTSGARATGGAGIVIIPTDLDFAERCDIGLWYFLL